jgi:hypothetical protein
LNPGHTAQILAFQNPNTGWWTLGFEDTTYGTGLAGLVGTICRRMR